MEEPSPLHDRLQEVLGDRSLRAISELTNSNAETVRRYMQGQAPSVEFLTAVCQALSINAQWLLSGRGPKKLQHVKAHALQEASASELLTAMAKTLDRLTDRIERIELFVHTLEARLRASHQSAAAGAGAYSPPSPHHDQAESKNPADARSQGPAAGIRVRASALADALPQRPRQGDH